MQLVDARTRRALGSAAPATPATKAVLDGGQGGAEMGAVAMAWRYAAVAVVALTGARGRRRER
jgi:hypothetical protein